MLRTFQRATSSATRSATGPYFGARCFSSGQGAEPLTQILQKPNIEMTTLPNGLRVVSDSTPGHFSAMGMYVDAGARFEDPNRPGLSHIFDRLAWKSTAKYTGVEILENLAKVGGNYICSAQRELMIYQLSVFNKDIDKMFDYMAQTVREPLFSDQEVEETLLTVDFEVSQLQDKHDIFLPEVLHAAAYQNNTLGLPLFCPQELINSINKSDILGYHKKFYQPQNIVVAMIGVSHDHAVKLCQQHLGDWERTSEFSTRNAKDAPQVNFTGGTIQLPFRPPITPQLPELYHMQIGFETTGLLHHDLYSLATLQKLLGGGSSFSAGGPGKGMFSRLYTKVLNQYSFVENCMAFNHLYVGSGIFGVTLSAMPDYGHVMAQVICQELSDLITATPEAGGIRPDEFKRAKNQLISSLLMNVESKISSLEDLGRQIQCQGKLTSINEMVEKIEELDIKTVRDVATKVLKGKVETTGISLGKAAIAIQGDANTIGDVDEVIDFYDLGKKN